MKNFIEYVAKSLVTNPDHVIITEHQNENESFIELTAPQNELGKVIGKHGHMADALRTLSHFYAGKILKKPLTFRIVEDTKTH